MKRREVITLVGGIAVSIARPLGAWSQQQRVARLGVLMVVAENDPDAPRFVAALETQLEAAGWRKGRNLEITYRWSASNPERLTAYANELVLAAPEVLVELGTAVIE
jgi:putative ABC transport system substrate-binding protein